MMPIDKDQFRKAMSRFASSVTVVTSGSSDGDPRGITVSAFCSLSLDPPLVLVCIDKRASFHQVLSEGGHFAVNILSEEQEIVSRRFASRGVDRFDGIGYKNGVTGAPVLDDVIAHLECVVKQCHSGGDHTIFVGQVEAAETADGKPLAYFQGGYSRLA
ncbi:MAG TPA: flavin reductase family protein [Blastocatellia bacterium]|jgi:flavin reductase (DIM6/NTAB) family NADH-FMN oxidoreductase RutF